MSWHWKRQKPPPPPSFGWKPGRFASRQALFFCVSVLLENPVCSPGLFRRPTQSWTTWFAPARTTGTNLTSPRPCRTGLGKMYLNKQKKAPLRRQTQQTSHCPLKGKSKRGCFNMLQQGRPNLAGGLPARVLQQALPEPRPVFGISGISSDIPRAKCGGYTVNQLRESLQEAASCRIPCAINLKSMVEMQEPFLLGAFVLNKPLVFSTLV